MTPGSLDGRITFTRASTGTYFDATGTVQTAATNAPRWDYDPAAHSLNGLLIEEPRTNLLLNSATLGTQSVTVTAQAYTLSFYGTGTITKSGTASGALVGTGAFPQRVSQTFTPTAGTLTLTVAGSVLNAQLEAGAFPTTWISTAGASATRAQDQCLITSGNMGFFVVPGGSWFAEFMPASNGRVVGRSGGAGGLQTPIYRQASNFLGQFDGVSPLLTTNTMAVNVVAKGATTWASPNAATNCLNGGAVASSSGALTTGYATLPTGLFLMQNSLNVSESMTGWMRRIRYWPRVLSAAELQSVTT